MDLVLAVPITATAMTLLVWVVLNFSRSVTKEAREQRNADFESLARRYESIIERSTRDVALAEMVKQVKQKNLELIEATNLNTKSLDSLEQQVKQLILRTIQAQDRFVDRTRSRDQTQVGEEGLRHFGNMSVVGSRREPEREPEGFVDEEAIEKARPLSPREPAAGEPT